MEYTRSIGDAHEHFEGTPEEIVKLINAIDYTKEENDEGPIIDKIVHKPIPIKEVIERPGVLPTIKTVGYTCDCGDTGCPIGRR